MRLLHPVAGVALDLVLIDDEGGGVGQLGQEVGLGLIDRDAEGEVVHDLYARYRVGAAADHILGADDVAEIGLGDDGGGLGIGRPSPGST